MPALCEPLLAWALAYDSAAALHLRPARSAGNTGAARRAETRRRRPRYSDERARILRAAVEVAASEERSHLAVLRIADYAGISEQTLLAHYPRIEDCFADAVDQVAAELHSVASSTLRVEGGPTGVYRAIAAMLEHLAADPPTWHLVTAQSERSVGTQHWERHLRVFVELLLEELPAPLPPAPVVEAMTGAVWGAFREHARVHDKILLSFCARELAFLALAPQMGGEAAAKSIVRAQRLS